VSKHANIFAEVEDFLKRFHDGETVVSPQAKKLTMMIPTGAVPGVTSTQKRMFADMLGWLIGAYQLHKDDLDQEKRLDYAYALLDYIERGRTFGLIKDLNLANKLKECQEQNARLKESAEKLERKILGLERENEELHEVLDQFGGRSVVA